MIKWFLLRVGKILQLWFQKSWDVALNLNKKEMRICYFQIKTVKKPSLSWIWCQQHISSQLEQGGNKWLGKLWNDPKAPVWNIPQVNAVQASVIIDAVCHPLHDTQVKSRSTFSARLISPRCSAERHRRSFLPVAIRLFREELFCVYWHFTSVPSFVGVHLWNRWKWNNWHCLKTNKVNYDLKVSKKITKIFVSKLFFL